MRSRHVALFAGAVMSLTALGAGENRLRLVLEVEGQSYDRFHVENGWILHESGGTKQRIPEYAEWRLEGDFLRHAIDMAFLPVHTLKRQDSPEWKLASMKRPYEVGIHLATAGDLASWPADRLENAIAIFSWVVDRKPVRIFAMDAASMRDAWIRFAVSEEEYRGFPTVMLHDGRSFVAPRPWFADGAANNFVVAIHFGATDILEPMLQQVGRVDEAGRHGRTLLHIAAAAGRADAVKLLVERRARTQTRDRSGTTPLALAAANGRTEAVQALLAAGSAPNRADRENNLPLHSAISGGHDAVAIALIDAGSDLSHRNRDRIDPALLALENRRANIIRKLAYRDGLRRHIGALDDFLLASVRSRHLDTALALLENGSNPDVRDDRGCPAIVIAATSGLASVAKVLLAYGADPDATTPDGTTALTAAVRAGDGEIAATLLGGGANPNAVDNSGNSALHAAVNARHPSLITLLAGHGAALNHENHDGIAPFDAACIAADLASADALVVAGLRFDPESPRLMERLERAISFDLGELIERAIEDGWDPAQRFQKIWPITVVAEFYSALRTQSYLQETLPPMTAPPIVPASDLTSIPLPNNAANPTDPRPRDQDHPSATVTVRGLLDADGNFLFARVTASPDERLSRAVLDAVAGWKFIAGSQSGQARHTRLTIPVTFPARQERIFSIEEVEQVPKVYRGDPVSLVPDWELADVLKRKAIGLFDAPEVDLNETAFVVALPNQPIRSREPASHIVSYVVEPNGRPTNIEIFTPVTSETRTRIIERLQRTQFTPGRNGGNMVRVRLVSRVNP